jgi:hypothetical protein
MGFVPTLVGAIIGAAVGVGLHQGLEMGMLGRPIEAPWFAIIIGLFTGLGVRQANKSLIGRVSYLRGAITGLIALAAIVGSIQLVSVLASRKGAVVLNKPLADAKAAAGTEEDADAKGDAAASAPVVEPVAAPMANDGKAGGGKLPGAGEPNVLQFVYMAVGAFIAYELGRGTGKSTAVATEPLVMMDPSN